MAPAEGRKGEIDRPNPPLPGGKFPGMLYLFFRGMNTLVIEPKLPYD
jgi:hypothetical protein